MPNLSTAIPTLRTLRRPPSRRGYLPARRLWWAAVSNLLGLLPSLVFGTAVATTIGKGIVDPSYVNIDLIAAGMCGVIVWGRIASLIGLPVSKSHALFAALAGAAFAGGGLHAIVWSGWIKIGQGIIVSVAVASSMAWVLGRIVQVVQEYRPMSDHGWRNLQLITLTCVAAAHGWNDGLKFVGVFALVLLLGGITGQFTVTPGIILICAVVMGTGTLCGGWRIVARIKKMAHNDCKPWQGVTAETISALSIAATAFGGVPMSTTHTVVSSIAGAKASSGLKHVDWKMATLIAWGWILTIIFCVLSTTICAFIGWKIIIGLYLIIEIYIQWSESRTRNVVPETNAIVQF